MEKMKRSKEKKALKKEVRLTRREMVHLAGCVICWNVTHFERDYFSAIQLPVKVPRRLRSTLGLTVGGA